MDFRIAYERFCQREKRQNKKDGIVSTASYFGHIWNDGKEVHHVLPKSLGGRNTAANYVALSPEKHKYAHVLLNLAFCQEKNMKALALLGYNAIDLPIEFIMRQRAMRGLKISIPIAGKKRAPLVLSLIEAAKYFCFAAHKNFNDKAVLHEIAAYVLRNAVFGMPWFGMKMHVVLDGKTEA